MTSTDDMIPTDTRRLDACIRLAIHAAEDAEGLWIATRTRAHYDLMQARHSELDDLRARRRQLTVRRAYTYTNTVDTRPLVHA